MKNDNDIKIFESSLSLVNVPNFQNIKASRIYLSLAFVLPHIQLITILVELILSNSKQKLLIQPNDFINVFLRTVLRVTTQPAY